MYRVSGHSCPVSLLTLSGHWEVIVLPSYGQSGISLLIIQTLPRIPSQQHQRDVRPPPYTGPPAKLPLHFLVVQSCDDMH